VPTNLPIPEDEFVRLRIRLGKLRRERGFTYDVLAAQAEISRSNLVALETGKVRSNGKPAQGSLAVWHRLARALGVPFSELMRELD
jgi:transcriptional regulator with XRE-family HTH domain